MQCKKEKHRVTAVYSPVKTEYSLPTKEGKIGDAKSIYMKLQLTLHLAVTY